MKDKTTKPTKAEKDKIKALAKLPQPIIDKIEAAKDRQEVASELIAWLKDRPKKA